ncbi:hypothetical protein TGDOM2_399680, partial [Toxoplasma gondii GAB2-2007-GAL-DOM2]
AIDLFPFLTMAPGLSHFLLLLVAGLAYFGKESTVWALRYHAAGDWNPLTGNAPELASDPVENADEPSSRIQSFVEASKDNSSSGGDRDKGEGDKPRKKGIGERIRNFFTVRKSASGTSKVGGKKETPAGKKETPTDKKETPTDKKETPTDKKETPAAKKETPAAKKETPEDKKETPTGKKETPEDKKETPAGKKETPAGKKETPAGKKETPADEKPELSDKQKMAQLIDSLSKQMITKLNYVEKELTNKVLPDDKPNAEAINSDLHLVAIDYKYELCNILQDRKLPRHGEGQECLVSSIKVPACLHPSLSVLHHPIVPLCEVMWCEMMPFLLLSLPLHLSVLAAPPLPLPQRKPPHLSLLFHFSVFETCLIATAVSRGGGGKGGGLFTSDLPRPRSVLTTSFCDSCYARLPTCFSACSLKHSGNSLAARSLMVLHVVENENQVVGKRC